MAELIKKGKIHTGVILTLFITLTVLMFYSPLFIRDFPLLKIEKVKVNISNPALEQLVKATLQKDFSNNWLYLWLNKDQVKQILATKSYAAVKNLNLHIDPFSRTVEIDLKLRQPVAKILGTPYYVAFDNVVVKKSPYLGKVNIKLFLKDLTLKPQAGEKYTKLRFDLLTKELLKLNLSLVKINNETIVFEGDKLKIISNLERNPILLLEKVSLIESQYPNTAMEVDFRNHKMVSIKIYHRGE